MNKSLVFNNVLIYLYKINKNSGNFILDIEGLQVYNVNVTFMYKEQNCS